MAATYPVSAPFNTNPSYSGQFIPTLWSSKLNAKFYKTTVFGEISNTNWEGDIKGMGDKVVINNIPTITVSDYVVGTNLTYEVPTPNTVELLIDKGKYFAFQISDVLEYQSQPKLMNMFSDDASMQMKISIDSTVIFNTFSLAAAANKGATAGALSGSYDLGTDAAPIALSGSNVLDVITSLSSVLDEQNVPETDRFLLIDPATRQTLMQSNLAQAQFMGDSTSILRNGRIGMIDRFTVYVSNNLPRGAAASLWASGNGSEGGGAGTTELKRRAVIAGHKSAITFASQMTKMETVRNQNDFGDFVRGLNVYGYEVVKDTSLAYAVVA
jgi:hypothetical protein